MWYSTSNMWFQDHVHNYGRWLVFWEKLAWTKFASVQSSMKHNWKLLQWNLQEPRTHHGVKSYILGSPASRDSFNWRYVEKVEKTNKSELWNRLTYRVLIYIFEVGMKTFRLNWEISRSKKNKSKKRPHLVFWGWRLNFFWAHVIMQDICNKLIELNFCVGCMVSRPNCLLQDSTTISLINKI